MISEFKISGVGNLHSLTSDKPWGECVLVHGENGAGKSTLAAVLRSLRYGDGQLIADRKTVGQDLDAKVEITVGDVDYEFADGKWSDTHPEMWVFDQAFVNRNVHSGDQMTNEHGKSLYSVILGETCGELLAEAEKLEDKVDDHNRDLRAITKELESHAGRGMTLEEFMALPKSSSLEEEVRRQEEKMETHRKRKKLDRAQTFEPIELPELSESFETVLKKSISNFLDNAEQLVHAHIEDKTKKASLAWLEQGCDFSHDDDCPFCGASVKKNDVVAAYKGFFSRDYNTLKAEINSLSGLIDGAFGERVVVKQQKILSENSASRQFWEDYIEVPPLDESIFDEIDDQIGRTRDRLADLADRKKQNPLDEVVLDVDLDLGASLRERIGDYNTLVEVANERIKELRDAQSDSGQDEDAAKLAALKSSAVRHQPEVIELVEKWQEATKKKDQLAKKRKDLQKKIKEETAEVFESRGEQINALLEQFDAGFRLGEFDTNNRTKPPSVQLRVCYDGSDSVRLDEKSSKSERPFDAALSSGERNILAFAFFMTNLAEDKSLADKTVVVDDPITNLDRRRLATTAEVVGGIAANQLVVLSHNSEFLDLVAGGTSSKDLRRQQLSSNGGNNLLGTVKKFG